MGQVIYPQPTNPRDIDFSWMVGRTSAEVSFNEPVHWTFSFAQKGYAALASGIRRVRPRGDLEFLSRPNVAHVRRHGRDRAANKPSHWPPPKSLGSDGGIANSS